MLSTNPSSLRTGRHHASPLAAFLRIPLTWYRSATYSFFPDESRATIRRAYSSPTQPHAKKYFCGYCGTPLSYWTEQPTSEAEYISLTLGSLVGEDLRELEDLGLIPPEVTQEAQVGKQDAVKLVTGGGDSSRQQQQSNTGDEDHDLGDGLASHAPWFDAMMEGSQLGQLTRDRRVHHARMTRQLGGVTVEWEIVEWTDDAAGDDDAGAESLTAGKDTAGTGANDPKDGNNARAASNVGGNVSEGNVDGGNNGENGSTKRKIGEMQEGGEEKTRTHQATVEDEATGDVEMKG